MVDKLYYIRICIVAVYTLCKPANSLQEYFTRQTKNKQNLILLLKKETISHIFSTTLRS